MKSGLSANAAAQPWVKELTSANKTVYEQVRTEQIEENSLRIRAVLIEGLNAATLDSEQLDAVARQIGTYVLDEFEHGLQIGLESGSTASHDPINIIASNAVSIPVGWD